MSYLYKTQYDYKICIEKHFKSITLCINPIHFILCENAREYTQNSQVITNFI